METKNQRHGWAFAAIFGGALAAIAGGAAVLASGGGPEASPGPSPSASASGSTEAIVAAFPDLLPADDMPWDEVGPGWFLITYDPHLVVSDDWHDGWGLNTGRVWVVAPDGRVFDAVTPPDDADYVAYWSGTEIWFATTDVFAESPMGTFSAVDVLTGAVRSPWNDREWLPWTVSPVPGGRVYAEVGCCGGGWLAIAEPDGSVRDVADLGDLENAAVTPDAAGALLVLGESDDEGSTVDETNFVLRGFDGDDRTLATLDGWWQFAAWIDDSTALVNTHPSSWIDDNDTEFATLSLDTGRTTPLATLGNAYWFNGWIDDDSLLVASYHEETGYHYASIDIATGETAPWEPPVVGSWSLQPISTGVWLAETGDPLERILISGDGAPSIPVGCAADDNDACRTWISGDRLLIIGDTPPENAYCGYWTQALPCERTVVTLVDLTTMTPTVLYDVTWPEDKVLGAVAYSEQIP